ncbi:MAG: carbohydrate porin [Bacteroidetes bacterium]|nr:carbohydrate porin [Bacteroidota bacterium]
MFKNNINQTKRLIAFIIFILTIVNVNGQQTDTIKDDRFSVHAQTTVITQYKPAFTAKYSGQNSLQTQEETSRSTTSTLYLGAKLWQGASVFINPEIAGGAGLSGSLGVGSSANGETYRIDNPAPTFELARLFFRQIFPLGKETTYQESDFNKLGGSIPTNYFSFTVGKICVADFFDNNRYSHDPRTQFMSWGLMSNGAWDFPANTRGYTPSVVLEYVTPENELRYGFSLVPTTPNGMNMSWNISNTGSHTLEFTHNYTLAGEKGALRLVSFFNNAKMGNYNQSIALNPTAPDLFATEAIGHIKYGFGINSEQALNKDMGIFFRASWNDGHNETWAFTEIDRSVSFGISSNGNQWNRQNDNVGLALVISGLSTPHRKYLEAGGNGFELGDGKLNYSLEHLAELYYSVQLQKYLYVSGTYQFILNPGYNKDRGPVNVFSIRVHAAF